MLLPMLIHAEPLESQIPSGPIMWLHRSRKIQWTLHPQIRNTVLHHLEINRNHACHLNRATERDLAIALREMQVADGELRTSDMDREEDLGATREVLDVAVPAVFRTAGDGARTFFTHFGLDVFRCRAGVYVNRIGRLSNDTIELVGCDELTFALIPG